MTPTYLFYDIETTGLNKAFDQVLQFAAIRTDMRLNELNRHTISVKLRPDVIPSPQAMLTNRISITEFSCGLCEYEAIRQIHYLMNQAGTISLGYNTLGFDDEFLRFSFHRNLLPPYTHQFQNGCRRMDLLPMAIIYSLYKRDVLTWPKVDGKPSLKLEHLASANHFVSGQSHEAIVDVETTVELARRFFKEKKTWRYLNGYFDKETDMHRIDELPIAFKSAAGDHREGLMVGSEYGPQQNYQAPLISIGTSLPYPNQTLWLRLDLPTLHDTTPETIPETTWVIRKRFGEPGILLPPHDRYWRMIGDERRALFKENCRWLQANPAVFQQIINYHKEYRYPFIPNLDADASLYQIGFFSRADEKICRKFHDASLENKADLVERFSSPDARTLAGRILCRNYSANTPAKVNQTFRKYLKRVNPKNAEDALLDYRGNKRTTPAGALLEISRLKDTGALDSHQHRLLEDLEKYVQTKFSIG
jgi:exodeoxyribonuclease-1